jgi:hypothetical protein
VYSEKTPDSGQRNCPKHVEFYSKNKFEKLVNLVGFIIRIYHDARSPERKLKNKALYVSDNSSVHHQEFFTVHTVMVYVI